MRTPGWNCPRLFVCLFFWLNFPQSNEAPPSIPQISSLSLSLSLFFLPWGLQLISTCSISKALLQRLHCCLFIQLWLVFLCELARGLFCSVNRKTSTVNADTCTRFGFGGCNFHFKAQNIISPRRWYVVYCLLFSSPAAAAAAAAAGYPITYFYQVIFCASSSGSLSLFWLGAFGGAGVPYILHMNIIINDSYRYLFYQLSFTSRGRAGRWTPSQRSPSSVREMCVVFA